MPRRFFFHLFSHRWLQGAMSVCLLPLTLLLLAWFVYLLEPGCFEIDRDYAACSMLGNLLTSLTYMVLGGIFLLILPLMAWLAQSLPDVTQGTITLNLMVMLALLNILFAARIAAWKGEYLLALASRKKWFFPGLVFVFLVGSVSILKVSSVVFRYPWMSIVAVIIAWILLVFYNVISIIVGEWTAGWMMNRGMVITKVEGKKRD